jgi:hypothetical protein
MVKKIEVEMEGRVVSITPQMLEYAKMFGAVPIAKVIKPMPKELIKPVKVEILPEMITTTQKEVPAEMIDTFDKSPNKRKAPVKSKSTK